MEKNARDKNIAKNQSVMVQRTMIFKYLVLASFLAVLAQTNPAWAQLPTAGGFAAVPDEWLLGTGQRWHHKTAPSNDPRTISELAPTQAEAALVIRAKKMLENGSARALLLANGRDVIWNGFAAPANPDSLFLSMSVGKTVTAMAVGQAICAGHLALDTKAETLLPELKGKDLGAATVHDLLRMSSGTWTGHSDSTILTNAQRSDLSTGSLNLVQMLESDLVSSAETKFFGEKIKPGEVFAYRSTDPLVLGVMIARSTGVTYANWVERFVLMPAGVAFGGIIGQDRLGYGQADGNVRLRISDWLRFATWVKERETSAGCFGDFVRKAVHKQIANHKKTSGQSFDGYGYFIWTDNFLSPDSYWAVGHGGQRIGWNHRNGRILVLFSGREDFMHDVYRLYADWSALP